VVFMRLQTQFHHRMPKMCWGHQTANSSFAWPYLYNLLYITYLPYPLGVEQKTKGTRETDDPLTPSEELAKTKIGE